MSTVISSDKHYNSLTQKIRDINGTNIKCKPSEIAQSIIDLPNSIEPYDTITSGYYVVDGVAFIIGDEMHTGMLSYTPIHTCAIPTNIIKIPDHAFYNSDVENIYLNDNLTYIGSYGLSYCNFTSIELPANLLTICDSAFQGSLIESIDIPSKVEFIDSAVFWLCYYLKTLIIRNSSKIVQLVDSLSISSTAIDDGNGYIYVPSSLLNSYKTATNWSEYANQFRALEDYTKDGTVTGEFDYSKI